MAIYRVKVPRCIDVVVEAGDPREALDALADVIELCGGGKIYVHLLEPGPRGLVEKERVLVEEL